MTVTADFDKGVNGAAISVGDPGSANAWDNVSLGGAGSFAQYSNTNVAHGALAGNVRNQTAGSTNLVWGASFGTLVEHWGRAYLFCTTYPSSVIFAPVDTGTAEATIAWNGAGTLTIDASNTNVAIPLSTYARVEWHYFHDPAVGFVVVKTFLAADSITPDDVKMFSFNTGTQANEFDFGNRSAGGANYTIWYDQCVAAAPAFPGPFPSSTIAPTIAGSSTTGSTLFCDGGTWNGGAQFALAYQWTRGGFPIPAATSSTYTTGASDAGLTVRCTVTATGIIATNEAAAVDSSNAILVAGGVASVLTPHRVSRLNR